MRRLVIFAALCVVALTAWSCIEEVQPTANNKPKIWFTRAPLAKRINYQNGFNFEWVATDTDDDLGLGRTMVRLAVPIHNGNQTTYDPPPPCRIEYSGGVPETLCVDPVSVRSGGWVRVYESLFEVSGLPDSIYSFSVMVRDARGGETVLEREFSVRFDDQAPIIDSVWAPKAKQPEAGPFTYTVFAHDVAKNQSAASPVESLLYWYRYSPAGGLEGAESPTFARENRTFQITVPDQQPAGVYAFRAKVMDLAGNVSPEYVCKFEIQGGGPK